MTPHAASEAASRRRLFRRRDFWQVLLDNVAQTGLSYHGYHADRADVYFADLPSEAIARLRDQSNLSPYVSLVTAIRDLSFSRLELWVERSKGGC